MLGFFSVFRRLSNIFMCYTHTLSFSAACPQGTFKSYQGVGLCQQCPANSRSTIEAATLCGCRNGYYRGDMDKPEDVCTSESVSLCDTKIHTPGTFCMITPEGSCHKFETVDFWTEFSWHITAYLFLTPPTVQYLIIEFIKGNICPNS